MTRSTLSLLLIAALTLSACAAVRDSRVNPANWFGRSQSETRAPSTPKEVNPLIPTEREGLFGRLGARQTTEYQGIPIDQVSGLVIERVPGGAIIRATAIADVDDVYDVQLTPANEDEEAEGGVLTYRFEGVHPRTATRRTTTRVRTFTAARRVTNNQLEGVRVIRVEGARNAQSTSRR